MTNQETLEQLEYAKGIINNQGKDYLDERDFPVLELAIEALGKNSLKNWRRNMNHGFKLHPDGTLEITMPKGKKVGRVLVCEAGTQNGTLMYPDCDDCIKHGGDWECDRTNCRKGTKQQATKASDLISRQSAISIVTFECGNWTGLSKEINKQIQNLPYAEPESAIPLSWIEGQIKWLKSLGNAFSSLTALQISAMVNKWRGEQDD